MKKLLLVAAATSLFATPAFAQFGSGLTDTSIITASIAAVCTIDAPAGGAVNISATTPIGMSGIQCNDPDGSTVKIKSLNSGVLRGTDPDNTTTIPYQLVITGAGTYNLATEQTLPGTADQAHVDGFTLPTSVAVAAPTGPAYADDYKDTITYTISAN